MPRELAQDRIRRIEREAAAALFREFEFRKTVPALMFRLKQLALKVNVRTEVNVSEEGFVMKFVFDQDVEEVLDTFSTEQWEAQHLERKLIELEVEQFARERRRELAQKAKAKLDPAELAALKEFGLVA